MKNWTIKKRIIIAFSIILALVACSGLATHRLLAVSKAEARYMNAKALPGAILISQIDTLLTEIHIDVLRVLLAKTAEDRKKYENIIAGKRTDILKLMDEYEKTINLAEDRAMFNQLTNARDNYVASRGKLFELCDAGKTDDAMAFNASTLRADYLAYAEIASKMLDWNLNSALAASTRSDQSVARANLATTLLSIVVLVFGIGVAIMIVSGLNRVLIRIAGSLGSSSAQVAAAAGQVSSASQTLAQGSGEQAAAIEETSSSLEEMASMTKRNAENASKANDLAKQARAAADKGAADMQTMVGAMEAIKVSSDDIAKIIKTIDEIAFQTNILALNAAVEAARAGEAGMGFAVVADEVRNLAQRCATAAKETAAKIESAITKTGQGVEVSGKVASALTEIVAKARQVDELAAEVAGASREQTQGITQINTAVGQMDKVTQSNAANAEESAAASQELNAQAAVMKESVSELLQLVGQQKLRDSAPGLAPAGAASAKSIVLPLKAAPVKNQNGNGHIIPPLSKTQKRSGEIPLEGDFKNF